MTLTRLLEINRKFVKADESDSVMLAERIWEQRGCPTGVRELIDLLEKVLSDCLQDGIRYAPILLQRKKALHRGTWAPRIEYVAALTGTATVAGANGGACSKCVAGVLGPCAPARHGKLIARNATEAPEGNRRAGNYRSSRALNRRLARDTVQVLDTKGQNVVQEW
jgi:hypothetical protein